MPGRRIPRDLLFEACRDLERRRQNRGSWPAGSIPEGLSRVGRLIFGERLDDEIAWISAVEAMVAAEAIAEIAETAE